MRISYTLDSLLHILLILAMACIIKYCHKIFKILVFDFKIALAPIRLFFVSKLFIAVLWLILSLKTSALNLLLVICALVVTYMAFVHFSNFEIVGSDYSGSIALLSPIMLQRFQVSQGYLCDSVTVSLESVSMIVECSYGHFSVFSLLGFVCLQIIISIFCTARN